MAWLFALLLISWAVRFAFATTGRSAVELRRTALKLPDGPLPLSGLGCPGSDGRAYFAGTPHPGRRGVLGCAIGPGERTLGLPAGGMRRGR
jgi:hypothetical protein